MKMKESVIITIVPIIAKLAYTQVNALYVIADIICLIINVLKDALSIAVRVEIFVLIHNLSSCNV